MNFHTSIARYTVSVTDAAGQVFDYNIVGKSFQAAAARAIEAHECAGVPVLRPLILRVHGAGLSNLPKPTALYETTAE